MSKLIVFSAPSGSGKSTIINYLLTQNLGLEFSISATSRLPRGKEQDGVEYYFLSPKEFRTRIKNDDFIEYEEVYKDCYYGTLKSEVDRIAAKGKVAIADLDVVGGVNVKKIFGNNALAIFIEPPSIDELHKRLEARKTDKPEVIAERITKAEWEMSFVPKFDVVIVNDDLEKAKAEALKVIQNFINSTQRRKEI